MVLIVGPSGDPAILVGNECWGTAGAAPLPMRRVLHQDLSLPSQPRDRSHPLGEVLGNEGIDRGARVGVVGWKTFADRLTIEAPAYLVDELRRRAGDGGLVENAGDLFIDPAGGLRIINDANELATLEAASCTTSTGVLRLLRGLHPGLRERDAVALLGWDGSPLSCHVMLTAGERARIRAVESRRSRHRARGPVHDRIRHLGRAYLPRRVRRRGCRRAAGGIRDYVERLVAPYFAAVVEWYEALHVGQTGGALQAIIDRRLGDPFFGIFLNPGHQIHLDEWVNSPIFPGSTIELRSGMALQVDIIPATGTPYFTTNIEDGIALADAGLRGELAVAYPEAWARIEARREFMREVLGIDLHPDVLPFSNVAAWLPPFVLGTDRAMTVA